MYIFGGRSDWAAPSLVNVDKYCSNIYYLDTSKRKWIRPKVYGIKPIGRRSHSACMLKLFTKNTYHNVTNASFGLVTVVYNGFFYIFGGFNKNKDLHFQDINRYDPVSSTWMKILPKGTPPCARRRQICQLVNDRIFISGGTSPIFPKPVIITDPLIQMINNLNLKEHDDLHILDLSKY